MKAGLRARKSFQYRYFHLNLRLAFVGGVGRHRGERTIAMRGEPLGVDAGGRASAVMESVEGRIR